MIDPGAFSNFDAEARRLSRNEVMVLEGQPMMAFVESGSIALFCCDVRDGAPDGPRRLLHRVGSGQALFSTAVAADHSTRFIMVPIKEATVRMIPLGDLKTVDDAQRGQVHALIDEWVELLARLIHGYPEPKLALRVGDGAQVELLDGQTLCPERKTVVWTKIESGVVHYMGSDKLPLTPESSWFPLDASMWLAAAGDARVATRVTASIEATPDLVSGLSSLHCTVLQHLRAVRDEEAKQERVRLRTRDLIQADKKSEALREVAAVLEPKGAKPTGDTPLMRAMSAVGQTLGIVVNAPMKSDADAPAADMIEAIARASHFRARRVTLTGTWWRRDCGPLLCHTDEGEPVAVIPRGGFRYEIYDPVTETSTPVTRRGAQRLSSDAWMLYRPLPEGKLKLVDLFYFSLRRRRKDLVLILVTGLVATLLGMIVPQATALLMDHAIPEADARLLLEIGAGLIAVALGQTIFRFSQGIVLVRLGTGSEAETQAAVWDRLLLLRPSFFREFSSGDLQSRVMAVSEVGRALSGVTLRAFFSGFLALLNLALLYYYSPTLTALAVVVGVAVAGSTIGIGLFVRRNIRELIELDGKLFGIVVQLINGVGKLRVAGAGGRAFTHWLRKYGETLKFRANAFRLKDHVTLLNRIIPSLSLAVLYLLAHPLLLEGRSATVSAGITLGTFLAFSAAFGTFLSGVISLSNTAVGLLDVFAKGRRVKPILEAEPEIDATKADPGRLTGRIAMHGVQFRYRDDGPMVLDGIDLRAEPGEFIALVGPSGSGKSTTLRLLLGLETPAAGSVTYDGQDLAGLDLVGVRRQIGVVLQSGKLDSGSIFDNIACGTTLSLDDAWAAIEDAGFADDVRQMPMGIHTIMSVGGGNLSGGQRQRLLIARALAHRPRILLFDEATGALDNRTQAIVSESLDRLNVTRVVIAHRLSTIRNAHRIYVVEGGRIIQSGRFDELIAEEDGLFARMMGRQLA